MKTFKYSARSKSGAGIEGLVEANTEDEAIRHLKDGGFIVEAIESTGDRTSIDLRLVRRRAKEKSLGIVCTQFGIILEAGMPIVRSLELVAHQTEDRVIKDILRDVADDVSAGYGLADSFVKHGRGLPSTLVEGVRAGEESGNLDIVFRRLGNYYEKMSKTRSKVKSSMVYPCFVLVVAVVVIAIIMAFAVPVFKTTFSQMGINLPWITKFVVDSSDFFLGNIAFIIGAIVLMFIAIRVALKNEAFRLRWSRIGVSLPVIGRINLMGSAGQYAGTMGVMLEAGLPVVEAVGVTARSMSNYYMSHALASTQVDLEAGKPLADCLAKTGVFPELVQEMTGVGEQTGSLTRTLSVLASYFDNEAELASSRALSVLEPVVIVLLAVVVCGILLAVYLPIFSLYGNAGSLS